MRIDEITAWEPELMKSDQRKIPKKGSPLSPVEDTIELSDQAKAIIQKETSGFITKGKTAPIESNTSAKPRVAQKEKLYRVQTKIDSDFYSDRKIYSAVAEKLLRLFGI